MDNDEKMFDIKIIPAIYALWDELGIPEEQRTEEIEALNDSFRQLYTEFVSHLTNVCKETREQIIDTQNKHKQAMKAYGISDEEIENRFSDEYKIQPKNLLKQLETANQAYGTFKLEIAERVNKLENLIHIANDLFDLLEIPASDRGEYSSLGDTDFTRERIDRFKVKISELTKEKEAKEQKRNQMQETIKNLLRELNTTLNDQEDREILKSKLLSDSQIEKLDNLRIKLEKIKVQRVIIISEMAVTITHLWDLLSIPDKERSSFLSSHSTIGDDVVANCKEEIAKLEALRDQKLPELIAEQRQEVIDLWDLLHVAVESRPRFEENVINSESDSTCNTEPVQETESQRNVREFTFLEHEILRLKKIAVDCHSLLESINQREDIIRDFKEVTEAASDPQRLMSRGRGYAQQLMKEEKARRRYKTTLPRLDKKLYLLLIDYKSKNGIDFEWDGKPYIEKLADVKEELSGGNTNNINEGLDAGGKKKKSKKQIQMENAQKVRTLPPSPRKIQFFHNENMPANAKAFSIRVRSPIKM